MSRSSDEPREGAGGRQGRRQADSDVDHHDGSRKFLIVAACYLALLAITLVVEVRAEGLPETVTSAIQVLSYLAAPLAVGWVLKRWRAILLAVLVVVPTAVMDTLGLLEEQHRVASEITVLGQAILAALVHMVLIFIGVVGAKFQMAVAAAYRRRN